MDADIDRPAAAQRGLQFLHEGGQAIFQAVALETLKVHGHTVHAQVIRRLDQLLNGARPLGGVGQDGVGCGLVHHLHGQVHLRTCAFIIVDCVLVTVRHAPAVAAGIRGVEICLSVL